MCPSCGFAVSEGAKFCASCGERLATSCPSCGAHVPAGARFCPECGTGLAASVGPAVVAVAPNRPAGGPTTERRLVSVLFADLVGFTPFAQDRDAEQVRELLSHYFDLASEVVGRYGGTIEKFIGDAVMAVWGTPQAHEDDAERAVLAGLELVDAVIVLGQGIQARAGVMTGEAAATLGAQNQGMVAGDLVNTASRLQSVAAPGTVLVGERTRDASGAAIRFEPAGPQALKGKDAPVAAWRALRAVGDSRGMPATEALEAPFVGRADELRLLKETYHATGRERRARLVSLVGQAGIGKSRLAWELETYLDGLVETVRWHRGRSPAYGEGVTFWALGEMVRRRAGLTEGDDEPTTRSALSRMVTEHVPDEAEQRWIEPRLLALLGLAEAPSGGREELFAAWRTFFERLASVATVGLVFEDIHWADDGLLDFIEHLLDWSRDQPIFVITLARPELLERRPGWGTDRRGAIAVRVEPLADGSMRELLDGMVPGLPHDVVDEVLARANGIPLYAVETVRMLVADGRLARADDGTYRPTRELGDLTIPTTLHALVAARLDALPADGRSLLQVASVLGQTFSETALAEVTGQSRDSLAAQVALLRRRELLTIETDPRSPARGQLSFVQALVREVAYSTLARRERRTWHLAAARYFESLGDEELAGVLATHHVAAWRAAPEGPEGDAAAAQARVSLHAAADRAESLGARRQAIDWLTTALEVTTDPAERAALLQRRGHTAWLGGFGTEAKDSLAAAIDAWTALGRPVERLESVAILVSTTVTAAEIGPARQLVAENLDAAHALEGDPVGEAALARFWEIAGQAAFRAAAEVEAISYCDLAIPLAERLGLDGSLAMCLITKAGALTAVPGRFREAIALLTGAVKDARDRGQHSAAIRGLLNLGALTVLDDPRGSLASSREALDYARRLGMSAYIPYIVGNLTVAVRTGDWDWLLATLAEVDSVVPSPTARRWLRYAADQVEVHRGLDIGDRPEERVAIAIRSEDPQEIVNGMYTAIDRDLVNGDIAAALGWARRVRDEANTFQDAWAMVGRAAVHAGDVELGRHALGWMTQRKSAGAFDVDAQALDAGIAALEGRTSDAIEHYREALDGYRDLGLSYDIARVAFDMAAVLPPGDPAVVAAVAEARRILTDLGAAPLLARLEELAPAATPSTPVTA